MVSALLTAKDVAQVLRKTEKSVLQAVADGLFPAGVVIRVGRLVRFHPENLTAWLENGGAQWPGGWRKEAKPEAPPVGKDRRPGA